MAHIDSIIQRDYMLLIQYTVSISTGEKNPPIKFHKVMHKLSANYSICINYQLLAISQLEEITPNISQLD